MAQKVAKEVASLQPDKKENDEQSIQQDWPSSPYSSILSFQNHAGNQATNRLLQTKRTANHPGDRFEREADHVAKRILQRPGPGLHRNAGPRPETNTLQTKRKGLTRSAHIFGSRTVLPGPVDETLKSSGHPIEPVVRNDMEARFGHDFSRVRIHTGENANRSSESLHARAYTMGHDVVFGKGRYQPASMQGRRLIAHELAHVVQQSGGSSLGLSAVPHTTIQREEEPGAGTAPPEETSAPPEPDAAASGPAASMSEVRPSEGERVQRIVMSRIDMRFRIETATTAYNYDLEVCSIPLGSYETRVSVTDDNLHLQFDESVSREEEFLFHYRVRPGQENPATLLRDQATVHVDVVRHAPTSHEPEERSRTPECVGRLADRVLIPASTLANRNLFDPITFDPMTIWSHRVPLGQFGWVNLNATVGGGLRGRFSARHGDARLTDICLTYLADEVGSSAPIEHPLLGRGSRADVSTYYIGGRARFHLPASAAITITGEGTLRIAGEYLDVIDLAAAEATLSLNGAATLAGEIDGRVEIIAEATRARARLEAPIFPIALLIENSTIDDVNLTAAIGLRGRAGVRVTLNLSAGFELAGINLWSQTWNLVNFNAGVAWAGGLKYSPNPGIRWDLGEIGPEDELDFGEEGFSLDDMVFHEDAAEVEEEDIIQAILDEGHATTSSPEGMSEDDPLPFDWHKTIELYPATIPIPNAEDPEELHRDDGPTSVRYLLRGRDTYEMIGVASGNWPYVGKTFQYVPEARVEAEKDRLRGLLTRLGYDRSGVDVDHVHELQFGGDDSFDNCWPADNSGNRSAGRRHQAQLANYEAILGNIAGRWFIISRIRI